ncbi:MAG: DEAD/DEAH box helicase [Muribaculaceae bacterium]|nr:DEAD/DEAH box helicase [Muribaculaceae bacterium]
MKFDELALSYDVLDALDAMNFDECTPIQEQAIPVALQGRDLIAVAQTGTGKTAAFLLPVIDELGMREPSDSVKCVVMTPTRELALQIDRQLEGFSYFLPISSTAIYGGTDGAGYAQQQRALKMGAEVIIATPGRLLAHLSMGYVDLSQVEFFILDEADRMLDMGFYDDIMQIAAHLPKNRQTLMFSATMPPKIQKMAKALLSDPVEVKIAVSKPTDKVEQRVCICHDGEKIGILTKLFREENSKRVIVFASSKLKVKELARELRRLKFKAGEMHSDLEQSHREVVMNDFRNGHIDILVATDIVARGIDIDDISMVVNFDVPHDCEDYVHRIGRTARANAEGVAVTLVGDRDRRKFRAIEDFLGYKVARMESGSTADETGGDDESGRKSRREGRSGRNRKSAGNRCKRSSAKTVDKPASQEEPDVADTSVEANVTEAAGQEGEQKPKRRRNKRRRKPRAVTDAGGDAGNA